MLTSIIICNEDDVNHYQVQRSIASQNRLKPPCLDNVFIDCKFAMAEQTLESFMFLKDCRSISKHLADGSSEVEVITWY